MAAGTNTVEVTDATFDEVVGNAKGLTIVDFWAAWCGPCRLIAPHMDAFAEQYAERGLVVGKLDVDANPRATTRFGVRSIPAVLFFKDGQHVDTVVGAAPKAHFEKKILEHL